MCVYWDLQSPDGAVGVLEGASPVVGVIWTDFSYLSTVCVDLGEPPTLPWVLPPARRHSSSHPARGHKLPDVMITFFFLWLGGSVLRASSHLLPMFACVPVCRPNLVFTEPTNFAIFFFSSVLVSLFWKAQQGGWKDFFDRC